MRECALLPRIAPHVGLPIPAPVFTSGPVPGYPAPFAGYARIAGTSAAALGASFDAARWNAPLAAFLRALHALDPAPLVAAGLPPDTIGRLDCAKRLRFAAERAPRLEAIGIDAAPLLAWLHAHPAQPCELDARVTVHGDLYARHVLGDERGPSGVIDWGDVHLGDPAVDLAIAFHLLPQVEHARFRAAYGPIADATWETARFRALSHAITEIDYGVREGDDEMIAFGRATIEHLGLA